MNTTNETVIVDEQDYRGKMQVLLEDPYKTIAKDPRTYLEKTAKPKIQAKSLNKQRLT